MATGFMTRHFIALLLLAAALPAAAADVSLVGTFDTKAAILSIDGGAPKAVKVGQSFGGVTVISVDNDKATVEVDGKRRSLARGQTFSTSGSGDRQSATLVAGRGGHYVAEGAVNGGAVRFIVDTGASMIALPASDANRLGIDYRKGRLASVQTAAGVTPAYIVQLDTVRVGGIELNNVEGVVIESGLPMALLGMSFLNRVEIRHEAGRMLLIRRF
jgi:aspartyl protease family protein